MPVESSELSDFRRIVDTFCAAGVEFIVIGGQAEVLFGSSRVTYDTDLCYRRTPDNLPRVVSALQSLNPTLRGAPPDVPFILDVRTFEFGSNFTFDTSAGKLDILGHVEPLGDFDQLAKHDEVYEVDSHKLRVIALDDLIRIKRHIHRVKDRDSLLQLLAIKQIRDSEKSQ
jgi:predicted nucleotidyltransferase